MTTSHEQAMPAQHRTRARADIVAARATGDRLRAACAAATDVAGGAWADREQQALDGLRAAAAFLRYHPNTAVARAITSALQDVGEAGHGAIGEQSCSPWTSQCYDPAAYPRLPVPDDRPDTLPRYRGPDEAVAHVGKTGPVDPSAEPDSYARPGSAATPSSR